MAAQQPDLNAILAALSQRPPSTPSQTPSQQNNAYQGGPPTPGGNFSLPQPSNSASMDLSSVKPSNSGHISLSDAIASTQNRNSQGSDPSRRYSNMRSRSRSRSPGRRESFRDNYNPYRDERRDDPRRAMNGRDRSFSPAQRAFGNYSNQPPSSMGGRGRDQDQNLADNQEIITVDSSAVGLIIGKNGESMRRIESESGARVQFINKEQSHGPTRQCRITGTIRQRLEAKSEILRIQAESPNNKNSGGPRQPAPAPTPSISQLQDDGSETNTQIWVPDKTVGLIIGRGGETIRDLQDRSGCHVNIVGENKSVNGMRPVNLIGTATAAAQAKDMILEVVASDTRNAAGGGASAAASIIQMPPPPTPSSFPGYDSYGYNAYGGPPAAPPPSNDKITESIMVPSEAVGMIIGKGGETIKDMQNQSSAKINVSSPAGADIERHIELIGTRQANDAAKRLIQEKVNAVREKQAGRNAQPATPSYGYGTSSGPSPMPQHGGWQVPSQTPQPAPTQQPSADPYAPYGGYQNYLNLWYSAQQNQQPPAQ